MVNLTAVRDSAYFGHSAAVHIETRTKVTVPQAQKLLNSAPGVIVMDSREPGGVTDGIDGSGKSRCRIYGPDSRSCIASQRLKPLGRCRQPAQGRRTEQRTDRRDFGKSDYVMYRSNCTDPSGFRRALDSRS